MSASMGSEFPFLLIRVFQAARESLNRCRKMTGAEVFCTA